jgi:hypothetical protein
MIIGMIKGHPTEDRMRPATQVQAPPCDDAKTRIAEVRTRREDSDPHRSLALPVVAYGRFWSRLVGR